MLQVDGDDADGHGIDERRRGGVQLELQTGGHGESQRRADGRLRRILRGGARVPEATAGRLIRGTTGATWLLQGQALLAHAARVPTGKVSPRGEKGRRRKNSAVKKNEGVSCAGWLGPGRKRKWAGGKDLAH